MDFFDYLQSSKKSLFRFEYLQDFNIPEEQDDFERFKKTGAIGEESMMEWWNFLESKHTEGVVLQRVRLVREPITAYTEWSLKIYKETVKHGDNIRVLPENKLTSELHQLRDFWLIDDELVLKINYGPTGEYLGFEKIIKCSKYCVAKQYLWKNSVPL